MKKMLLLLVCLTTFAWLHAETATFTCKDNYGSSTVTASTWKLNDYLTFTYAKGSNSNPPAYNKAGDVRVYAGNTVTLTATNDYKIEAIAFTLSSQGKSRYPSVIANTGLVGAQAVGDSQCTWSGDATTVTFTVGDKSIYATDKTKAGQLCYTSVTVTYSKVADKNQVAKPTFSYEGEVEAGTKVEIDCKTADAKIYYTTDETDPTETSTLYDASTGIIVNEAMTIKAIAVKEGLDNSAIASATYTIKKPVVDTPTFDPESSEVEKGRKIGIFCTTEGAKIYYTTDNTTPNAESMLYDAASGIIVDKAMTIKAIAIAEGYNDSEVATVTYSIEGEAPMSYTAQFDFSDPTKLNPAQDYPSFEGMNPSGSVTRVLVAGVEFTNNYVVAEFVAPGNATATNTPQIMYNADAENNKIAFVRAFKNSGLKITGLRQLQVEKIEITGTDLNNVLYNGTAVNSSAKTELVWERPAVSALAETSENDVVEFKISSSKAVSINTIKVTTLDITNGVDDIIVDENAPVEYYNLQGVRVANPENGIYIRRQGSKVSKVLVK